MRVSVEWANWPNQHSGRLSHLGGSSELAGGLTICSGVRWTAVLGPFGTSGDVLFIYAALGVLCPLRWSVDPTDVMASYRTRMPTQNPQMEVPSALVSVGEPFWWGSELGPQEAFYLGASRPGTLRGSPRGSGEGGGTAARAPLERDHGGRWGARGKEKA